MKIEVVYRTRLGLENDIVGDYEKLWDTGRDDADVMFHFGDEGVIKAHKFILTTRLAHFRNVFAAGMTESRSNKIVIRDSDLETFTLFLRYLYCGKLAKDLPMDTYVGLFTLANKYDVPRLFAHCLVNVRKKLSLNSAKDLSEDINKLVDLARVINVAVIEEACKEELSKIVSKAEPSVVVSVLILAHSFEWTELKKKYAARLTAVKSSVDADASLRASLEAYPVLVVDLLLKN